MAADQQKRSAHTDYTYARTVLKRRQYPYFSRYKGNNRKRDDRCRRREEAKRRGGYGTQHGLTRGGIPLGGLGPDEMLFLLIQGMGIEIEGEEREETPSGNGHGGLSARQPGDRTEGKQNGVV